MVTDDYARGLADGARQERERVVAWLRVVGGHVTSELATHIERGDHIPPDAAPLPEGGGNG